MSVWFVCDCVIQSPKILKGNHYGKHTPYTNYWDAWAELIKRTAKQSDKSDREEEE